MDLNTRFFHDMLQYRLRRNIISGVNTSEGKIESIDGVKGEVKSFFESRFEEVSWRRTNLGESLLRCWQRRIG